MEKAKNSDKTVTFVERDEEKDENKDEDEEKEKKKKRLRSHSTKLKLRFIGKDLEDERYSRESPIDKLLYDGHEIDQDGTNTPEAPKRKKIINE
tara:strand:- start:70 stop:351 length:282 start_codon:yes stop_codon:yes gene_type:complete